jgi:hypothetical protein
MPFVSLSPDAIDFGDVAAGSSLTMSARLTNEGRAEAAVEVRGEGEAAICTPPSPVAFCADPRSSSLDGNGRVLIEPGETLWIDVSFAPSTPDQESSGALTFRTCPKPSCEARMTLTGRSVEPTLRCSPARVDFGPTVSGSWSEREVSCTPAGDEAVTVRGWTMSLGGFSLVTPPKELSLAPGESFEVRVACCEYVGGSGYLRIYTEEPPLPIDVLLEAEGP